MSAPPARGQVYSAGADLPRVTTWSGKYIAVSQQVMTGPGLLMAVAEMNVNTTAPCGLWLQDGTDSTGNIVAVLQSPAAGYASFTPGPPGVPFKIGLYLNRQSGSQDVVITWIPLISPVE